MLCTVLYYQIPDPAGVFINTGRPFRKLVFQAMFPQARQCATRGRLWGIIYEALPGNMVPQRIAWQIEISNLGPSISCHVLQYYHILYEWN